MSTLEIHSPPDLTRFLVRSVIFTYPWWSMVAPSQVRNHPSSDHLVVSFEPHHGNPRITQQPLTGRSRSAVSTHVCGLGGADADPAAAEVVVGRRCRCLTDGAEAASCPAECDESRLHASFGACRW
jgi:hypothetical protein